MPLPIIILVERHWDAAPKSALMQAISFLKSSGYDTLCFESPGEKNEQETIADIESTIAFVEARLTEANNLLAKRGISCNLSEMHYEELQDLLHNYVSSRYSKDMALWFKELPGHRAKLALVRMAVEHSIEIHGIDLTSAQLESINGMEAQLNLHNRSSAIRSLDEARNREFKNNMLELQREGKGVVFVVGQAHYVGLIEEFSKNYPISEIVFLHPYSARTLSKSYIDYNLPVITKHEDLILLEKTIYDDEDIEIFLASLRNTIQPMLDNSIAIESTSTCQMLNDKTHLNFEAYVRPSRLVDCYHFFNDNENITDISRKLKAREVHGFFTSFRNRQSYCVPNINITEVASRINDMNL